VLREACRQLRSWQERFTDHPRLSMSVNLSKKQVTDAKLVRTIAEIIKDTKIEPRSLRLEITESTIVDDIEGLTPALKRLKGLGVQLAMDDFGTGQSSLGFLHRIPMDILKIDRSFIDRAGKTRDHAAIIHTVVQLAHNLSMEVVAEGVETRDQISLLQSLECNYGQGYLFGEPVSAEAVESLVKSGFEFGLDSEPPISSPAAHVA
jgi:EAL domain-containing protein (putative c-di-GMP-specific phosphodiesterase class I)